MADGDPQYQINEQLTGIRFYNGTPLIGISASFTIESNLTASGGPILKISATSLSGSATVSSNRRELFMASASLGSTTTSLAAATEVLKFIAYLSGEETTVVSAKKFAKTSVSLSSSATATPLGRRIRFSSASISPTSSLTAGVGKVIGASASLSNILSINISDPLLINTIDIPTLSLSTSLLIADLIRFTPDSRYPGSILTMFLLDGQPLTSQGRTFSDSIKQIYTEQKNWNNTKSRYYKRDSAGKLSFKLAWDWLPAEREFTIDKRFARNFIKEKAMDPDIHTLTVISYGTDPEDIFEKTDYNVFITGYNEDLIRRDLQSGVYLWKCDLDLEEA